MAPRAVSDANKCGGGGASASEMRSDSEGDGENVDPAAGEGGKEGGQEETSETREARDDEEVEGGQDGKAPAAAADAVEIKESEAAETGESAKNGEETGFSVERCMPCWPSYYEGIEPRVASVARAELAGEEEHEDGGDSETGGGAGMPVGLLQIIALIQGLAPGDIIALPSGQHVLAADLLGALANQGDDEDEPCGQ